jgi:hypothetical protein
MLGLGDAVCDAVGAAVSGPVCGPFWACTPLKGRAARASQDLRFNSIIE